jgi:hypothetical protein
MSNFELLHRLLMAKLGLKLAADSAGHSGAPLPTA